MTNPDRVLLRVDTLAGAERDLRAGRERLGFLRGQVLPRRRHGHVLHPAFQQATHPIGVGGILRQLQELRASQLQQHGVGHADGQHSEPLRSMAQVHPEQGPSGLDPAEVAARSHGLAHVGLRREQIDPAGAHHEDRIRVVEQRSACPRRPRSVVPQRRRRWSNHCRSWGAVPSGGIIRRLPRALPPAPGLRSGGRRDLRRSASARASRAGRPFPCRARLSRRSRGSC